MDSSSNSISITTSDNSLEAKIKSLVKIALGMVDKQTEINQSNVDLFAGTAFLVITVLRDIDMLKDFIKLMETLGIKLPPDLKKIAGMELTVEETSKLGQNNMLLQMLRVIYFNKEGKLRSFENHAYPMTELLKDDTLTTLDQIKAAVEAATHVTSGGKTLKGIEALRARERESRNRDGSRKGVKLSPPTIPMELSYIRGRGKVPAEIADTIKFNDQGFGKIIVRQASDGTVDFLFGGTDVAGVTESLIDGWEKVKDSFLLGPRFKVADLPKGILAALCIKEAA